MKNFSEIREQAPRIVTLNIAAAKTDIQKAIKGLTAASGKHADKSTKMAANRAIKILKTAIKELG